MGLSSDFLPQAGAVKFTGSHETWQDVSEHLTKPMSAFVYVRYYQIVSDLSPIDNYRNRRNRITSQIKHLMPDLIVAQAEKILKDSRENLQFKKTHGITVWDNGFDDFSAAATKLAFVSNDDGDTNLALGKDFQFLLDTDRKRFSADSMSSHNPEIIRDTALCVRSALYRKTYRHC